MQEWFYGLQLTFKFSLYVASAVNVLQEATLTYGHGNIPRFCSSARLDAVLKSGQQYIFLVKARVEITEHVRLINEGIKRFEVGHVCNNSPNDINVFYARYQQHADKDRV